MAKDLTAALHALTEQANGKTSRQNRTLPSAKPATDIPARSGSSGLIKGADTGTGSIASPLVETAYVDRTFHAETNILSTDGLIVLKVTPVKTIAFKDANDRDVTIEFKAPA